MHAIIAGGTGFVGQALIQRWLAAGHQVTVVGRSVAKIQQCFGARVLALAWSDVTAASLAEIDVIVNLAGAGIADRRWSAARKQEILQSRVRATQTWVTLLQACGKAAPLLLNASAIGVYGLQKQASTLPAALDETTSIDWEKAPDFLAEVGRAWEKATQSVSDSTRVVNCRFGVVFAKTAGALPQMVRPFYFGVGGRVGTGQQPLSWVALDDLLAAIDFILATPSLRGPVNIVAPGCVMQRDFAKAVGKVLHRPACVPMPAWALSLLLGHEMAEDLLLEGQHVYPLRLLQAGFTFSYPDVVSALTHFYKK